MCCLPEIVVCQCSRSVQPDDKISRFASVSCHDFKLSTRSKLALKRKASSNQTQTTGCPGYTSHQTNHWQRNKQEINHQMSQIASPVIIGFGLGIIGGVGYFTLTKDERPSARELRCHRKHEHVDEWPIATWEETTKLHCAIAAITSKKTSQ